MDYNKRQELEKINTKLFYNTIVLNQEIKELNEKLNTYKNYIAELERNNKIYKHQYTKLNKKWQKIKEMQIYFKDQNGEEE